MKTTSLKSFIILISTFLITFGASALDKSYYADHSVLSEGNWRKIKVQTSGMVLVTDAQLRSMGFSNPQAVHVYGTGGHEVTWGLSSDKPDDLPLIASIRTSKGLLFYAIDNVMWSSLEDDNTPYTHFRHRYADASYYFLSDIAVEEPELVSSGTNASVSDNSATSFIERALHEKELDPATTSGADIWGEDFRSLKSQTFDLSLPGNISDYVTLAINFGAKTINGTSSILVSANGTRLPSTNSDKLRESNAHYLARYTRTVKKAEGIKDNKISVGIEYNYTGVLYKAQLDYIEAFYERSLSLNNGELHFYGNNRAGAGFTISGCSASTVIWDVTDPVNIHSVDYTLDGDKASFTVLSKGYKEFIAFEPESVNRSVTVVGSVANQDLHSLETPDMVIITLPEYRAGAEKIARTHEEYDGMRVHVLSADDIFNEFSGGHTDPGAFRRMLKMWYDRGADSDGHEIRYAILMGKTLNDIKLIGADAKNAGFRPMVAWQTIEATEEASSYCNDSSIGMLEDVTDELFDIDSATMQVAVGRIPCKNSQEALDVANKIEKYVATPAYGEWRNKVMLLADDDDGGVHVRQTEVVYNNLRLGGNGGSYLYDRIYLDTFQRVMSGIGATYPQATGKMLDNYNSGILYANYVGHAHIAGWGHEHLWDWPDIEGMKNKNLMFIYAATCSFSLWDTPTVSAAEELLLNPDGGVISMIAAVREVFINDNGILNSKFAGNVFRRSSEGGSLRWGDVFIISQNGYENNNKLRYAFNGDPALRIPGSGHSVRINTIDGTDVTHDNMPELSARSSVTVEGEILTADGETDTDFDGTLSLQLYDGERVVTTLGQGSNGVEISYNDRDKRLSMVKTAVKNGKWKAVVRIPPEIQGNYTPALLNAYAWDGKGKEANGHCENFYVYGWNEEVTDTEGPLIETFYVNNPNLGENAIVTSNMIVFARLKDESGINISSTGIGHEMTLCIDGKEYVSGLSEYYSPDLEDPDRGMLTFPLNGVSPGKHTLTLTAWDNVNNVSKADLEIEVGAALDPIILDIIANTNSETSSVDFKIYIDRPNTSMNCTIGIYDLNGRRVWEDEQLLNSDYESILTTSWNLRDKGGNRVPRGIYIYRATVESEEGMYTSKSKKIAISAQQTAQ